MSAGASILINLISSPNKNKKWYDLKYVLELSAVNFWTILVQTTAGNRTLNEEEEIGLVQAPGIQQD
ncbi:hypothetical protein SLA2020_105560 [Shorea laevis]